MESTFVCARNSVPSFPPPRPPPPTPSSSSPGCSYNHSTKMISVDWRAVIIMGSPPPTPSALFISSRSPLYLLSILSLSPLSPAPIYVLSLSSSPLPLFPLSFPPFPSVLRPLQYNAQASWTQPHHVLKPPTVESYATGNRRQGKADMFPV